MIYDVETFDDIIALPIRPQAQFYMASTVYTIGGRVIASNVLDNDIDFSSSITLAPNPNNLKATTLAKNGYKVDDPNLRIYNSRNYCNLMFDSVLFTSSARTKSLFYKVQHPFETSFVIRITIAPLYIGSYRFDWIEYDVDDDSILSTQSITLTETEDYEDLEFDVNPTDTHTAYKLMATALDDDALDCRINFDTPEVAGESRYLITNANLINFSSNEHADLYSQSRSAFEYTVDFLDIDRLYDPENPQGRFSSMVIGSTYRMFMGYNINGLFVDAHSIDWISARQRYFLKDLPTWENEKVTLHLTDDHTFNSNFTTQVPYISFQQGLLAKKFAPSTIVNPGKQVLTDMSYRIRFTVGPYSFAFSVPMTIEDASKIIMETTGYLHNDISIEDVYSLCQNALGCWNYGKNVGDISAANVRDYTIDDSVIYNEGISLNKQPLLKTLTIKKYNNTRSESPQTYTVTLQASDFVRWSDTDVRPYRAELKISNPLTNVADIYSITSTNVNPWVWGTVYNRNYTSGLCRWIIYIYVADPSDGSGDYTVTLYPVDTKTEDISDVVKEEGENLTIYNPFITSDALVTLCATAAKRIAAWRDVYEIDVMENFKLRVGDIVKLNTIYEQNIPVIITGLQFNIPGPKGHITCRRIS